MGRKYNTANHHMSKVDCEYADEFLGHKSSCLDCPFDDDCILNYSGKVKAGFLKARRDQEILNLIKQGVDIKEIAGRFGIHVRTVQRAKARSR